MNITSVDAFVRLKVLPEYQSIVAMLRDLMRETAPNAREGIAYGIPVWKANRIFAVISPNKKGITFSFTHGTEFEDKYGLLKGVGKVGRHIKIKNIKEINKEALRYYIKQALKIDAGRKS